MRNKYRAFKLGVSDAEVEQLLRIAGTGYARAWYLLAEIESTSGGRQNINHNRSELALEYLKRGDALGHLPSSYNLANWYGYFFIVHASSDEIRNRLLENPDQARLMFDLYKKVVSESTGRYRREKSAERLIEFYLLMTGTELGNGPRLQTLICDETDPDSKLFKKIPADVQLPDCDG